MVKGDSRIETLETGLSTLGKEVEGIAAELSGRIGGMADQFNARIDGSLLKQLVKDKGVDQAESSCVAERRQEPVRMARYERSPPKSTRAELTSLFFRRKSLRLDIKGRTILQYRQHT